MGFLQPVFLFAMPLMAIPVVIHLLNQRRHQTMPWAATRFLLQAMNMHRGRTVLRRWAVLALRVLAIGALIAAVSRPLTSQTSGLGFLGQDRVQILVLDRSLSMGLKNSSTGLTWCQTALGKFHQHLKATLHDGSVWICHSLSGKPLEMQMDHLLASDETTITAVQADLPGLIERSLNFVESIDHRPCDIWVCTDRQASEWKLTSGQWGRIQDRLKENSQVRFHFLLPEKSDEFNLAISASQVSQIREADKNYVLFDFMIKQTSGPIRQMILPVQVSVAGIERTIDVQISGNEFVYRQMKIELPDETPFGGGVIEIPGDANAYDNQYFFSFAVEPKRRSVVVTDSEEIGKLVQLVLETPVEERLEYQCEIVSVNHVGEIDWTNTAMLVWHAPLPSGLIASQIERFVTAGGNAFFLPVTAKSDSELFGIRWGDWQEVSDEAVGYKVGSWRAEDDLIATDDSGKSIPIGSITCRKRWSIDSPKASLLACFDDGQPLLIRAALDAGNAYFLATSIDSESSSFTEDGIALFVILHRSLEQGISNLRQDQMLQAGTISNSDSTDWNPLLVNRDIPPDQKSYFSGVYSSGNHVIAVNRSRTEDDSEQIAESEITPYFSNSGADFVMTSLSSTAGLSQEVWKIFVLLLMTFLIAEGWISLPPDSRLKLRETSRWVSIGDRKKR